MTGNEIRKKYLEFFQSKKHRIISSDSLVPKDDPTVLFTTAGMQQFKRQFLGEIDDFTRATTSQKCLRTDDLDQVGKTDCHHTFFEMLGNFSFGDYFKKDAIHWAWEFLTKVMEIPSEKLWVSVYNEDTEAEEVWKKEIGIPNEKIFRLGGKSNFWPSNAKVNGPNGPCGPCSEIFFDYEWDKHGVKNPPKDPDDVPGRFTEVWNLVFTQFNRKDGGILDPLPNKNIDTGMGLERLIAVMQGKKNNFEIDIFVPILKSIEQEIDAGKGKLSLYQKRVLADHIRAVTFGVSDGVIPSNEGRGYIMKKLIITMAEISLSVGNDKPLIHKLVPAVVDAMGASYPEIKNKAGDVADMIESIEKAYIKLRIERIPELVEKFGFLKDKSGEEAIFSQGIGKLIFAYRDTYGLPLPTILETLEDLGLTGSVKEKALKVYEELMAKQQEQSRLTSKMTGDVFTETHLNLNVPKTDFAGNNHFKTTSTILRIFKDNQPVHQVIKGDEVKIVLDKTPFYAESGGQIGDIGIIIKGADSILIKDTHKKSDVFLHSGVVEKGEFKVGDLVCAEIDMPRREAIMRNHTATHLLQASLREVLGSHVQQQGSYVSDQGLRFDFTHHKAVSKEELVKIERRVNELVVACDSVTKEHLSIEEAKGTGALAFFAEKYGDTVRVVSIGDYSKEFCGGTHLDITGQIGLFKIVSESAIAQGIRRIEAKTGLVAYAFINEQESILDKIADTIKAPSIELADKVQVQLNKIKDLEKEIGNLKFEIVKGSIDQLIASSEIKNETLIITHTFNDVDMGTLRKISDLIRQKAKSMVAVLGAKLGESASLLVCVSDDLIKKDIKADHLIGFAAEILGGKGGGRPQMAQTGSREIGKIEVAVKKIGEEVRKKFV